MANQQILILTEIVTMDPKEQASRLKEVEKMPLNPENLMRIKALRSNIESLPSTPPRHAVTQYSRFVDAEFNNFSLSPEILSEKLYDSVKMIRDLMNSNKKLKDTISDMSYQRKIIETENIQLHNDNQELMERVESMQAQGEKHKFEMLEEREVARDRKEQEKLVKKIMHLENEKRNKKTELNSSTGEWNWRSKRTILRNQNQGKESKSPKMIAAERQLKHRSSVEESPPPKAYRPLSQELIMDSTKQEAIATLSKILMRGMPY